MSSKGEVDSFEAVALPHLNAAYNLARWLMRNDSDAEDVVQEAMLRALTYFESFSGANARGWLLQIVRNTAYTSLRLNRGMQLVPLAGEAEDGGEEQAMLELADPGDDPEAALLRKGDRREVDRLMAQLPVELREAIVLRELEQLSYKEIARIIEAPIGTVMSRLWRARRMLAKAAAAEAKERSA